MLKSCYVGEWNLRCVRRSVWLPRSAWAADMARRATPASKELRLSPEEVLEASCNLTCSIPT